MRATVDEDIAQQRVTDDTGAFGSSVTGEQIAQPAQGIDCDRYSRQLGRDGPMDNGLHREVVHRTELLFAINPRQSCQRVEFLHRVQASSFHRPRVVPKAHLLPPADVATWRAYEHYFSPGFSEATGHVQPEVVEHPIPMRDQPNPRDHAAAISSKNRCGLVQWSGSIPRSE